MKPSKHIWHFGFGFCIQHTSTGQLFTYFIWIKWNKFYS